MPGKETLDLPGNSLAKPIPAAVKSLNLHKVMQ